MMRDLIGLAMVVLDVTGVDAGAVSMTRDRSVERVQTGYICNYALVRAEGRGTVPVHMSTKAAAKVTARLAHDTPVYVCDETRAWYRVRFGGACAARATDGLPVERVDRCPVGWMRKSHVEVVSG